MVKLVTMWTHRYHHYANMVEIIKDYMKKDWNFVLTHVLHEENTCAYILVKMGANFGDPLIMVNGSFFSPSLTLVTDVEGVSFITI